MFLAIQIYALGAYLLMVPSIVYRLSELLVLQNVLICFFNILNTNLKSSFSI